MTLARAIERLMLLDAVLSSPEYVWLATAREKVDHFERVTSLHADAMPQLVFQARFDTLVRTFRRQRDWALYRSWKRDGDGAVYGATSPLLAAALASQDGRITRHTLTHHYLHLAPLVGSA